MNFTTQINPVNVSRKSQTIQSIDQFFVVGNGSILDKSLLAVFSSIKCPASLILQAYDLAHALKAHQRSVISGFHSPIEREMLVTLLKGQQPIIICPARSLHNMRIPKDYQPHIESGRLLMLSPFASHQRRATRKLAMIRNQVVAALADAVFVAYAEPGGHTEQFCKELLTAGKHLYTFQSEYTQNLIDMGCEVFDISRH